MDAALQHIVQPNKTVIITMSNGKSYQGFFIDQRFPFASFDCNWTDDEFGPGNFHINIEHIVTIGYPEPKPEQVIDEKAGSILAGN